MYLILYSSASALQRSSCDLGVIVEVANLIKGEEDPGSAVRAQGQEGVKEESDKGVPLIEKSPKVTNCFASDDWASHVQKRRENGEETREEEEKTVHQQCQ